VRVLVLGGTEFLGRHLVDAALERGHDVVLFNRGRTNPDLYPQLELLRGDRDGELAALERRRFDAVIDTSGYVPRVVGDSAERLAGTAGAYVFISSISVYADFSVEGIDESAPVESLEDESSEDAEGDYGALKALCEQEVLRVFGERAVIIRPGLIVGPFDPTNRFTYWVTRAARGGDILAPAPRNGPVQLIDARDLAAWTISLIEGEASGVYNATGRPGQLSFADVVGACVAAASTAAEVTWVDAGFLSEHGVRPWSELPLWVPEGEWQGFVALNVSRATAAGLEARPIEDTVRATGAWVSTLEAPPGDAGLAPEREKELLAEWRAEHV